MAESIPGPSHTYYTTDEVLDLLEDEDFEPDYVLTNEPVCDGSDDDLEAELPESDRLEHTKIH